MTVAVKVERLTPCTTYGYGVEVAYTYTSFDKKEIDSVEEQLRQQGILIVEVEEHE